MFEKTVDGTVYTITRVNGTNRYYEGEVILVQEKDHKTFTRRLSELRYESISFHQYDRWKQNRVKVLTNYLKEVVA